MDPSEVDLIYRSALRILDEVGMEIQNQNLLQILAGAGLGKARPQVDFQAQRVRFPVSLVEGFLAEAEKYDWEHAQPLVNASAGVYHSLYHDPVEGALLPWDEDRLAFYFSLARSLPHVGRACMLGCRFHEMSALEPLYERYYCWKYGAEEGGSICLDELCPALLDLYQARAAEQGRPLAQAFQATVYLVPALKLGRHEAYQVLYFHERGLKVNIGGSMLTMGATAPVTLAGAVTLNLAEQLALRLLEWALWGEKKLSVGASISVMDMRTTIRPFGRPEMAIANLMTAQIARSIGAAFGGHAGLSDAKLPSPEASAQKALTAIPTLLAGGHVWFDAGLLGIDEVCSPIQMVLDDELMSALKRYTHDFEIDPETIGLETIFEAGPGGQYLDKIHTATHFRREHWNPGLWSREMLHPWLEGGCKLDVDRARERILDMQKVDPQGSQLPETLEREILEIIKRAGKVMMG
jgi:trimethylamine--corrinoid protein Co-methyltransferase